MNEQGDGLSRGPLALKFIGVDDETTSEEEEDKNDIQTNASNSVVITRNGGTHNLTVNNCYGNKKHYWIFF
jgi:hypothetical protein